VDAEDGRRLAEVQVTVITSRVLAGLSSLIGWAYFACWSISFYPQMWENYARQSVVGLNFDFLWLNLTGWVCYTAYNVGLYCVPAIQRQYAAKHPGSEISVLPNDVFFAIHALIVTVATIYQTYIYEVRAALVPFRCLACGCPPLTSACAHRAGASVCPGRCG
jgi:cystinosin